MSSPGVNKVVFEELSTRSIDEWNLVENGDNFFRTIFVGLRKSDLDPTIFCGIFIRVVGLFDKGIT